MTASRSGPITVSVPAREEFVHVLRAVAASVASRIPLSFEGIEDLRLAVDESCGRLLAKQGGSTTLTLSLRPSSDRLEAVVTVDALAGGERPPAGIEETLGWRLLTALVDSVTLDDGPSGPSIHLVKVASVPTL